MEDSLNLFQLKCGSCGAILSRIDKFETQIRCPYCGTQSEVTGTISQNVAVPERMILFRTTANDFEMAIGNLFVHKDYVINDIFDKMKMENATPIYLPMFLYEGKYEINNIFRTVKNRYAYLCLAYEGQEIIPELAEWTKTFPYNPTTTQAFDSSKLKGYQILPQNIDKETVWNNLNAKVMNNQAEYNEENDGRLILVPFWFVYYMYGNQKHYVMFDGLGKNLCASVPEDEERKESIQFLKNLGNTWSWIYGILLFILSLVWGFVTGFFRHNFMALLIGSFFGFIVGLIVGLGSWAGLVFYSKYRVKKIFKDSRKIRQAAFNRIIKKP